MVDVNRAARVVVIVGWRADDEQVVVHGDGRPRFISRGAFENGERMEEGSALLVIEIDPACVIVDSRCTDGDESVVDRDGLPKLIQELWVFPCQAHELGAIGEIEEVCRADEGFTIDIIAQSADDGEPVIGINGATKECVGRRCIGDNLEILVECQLCLGCSGEGEHEGGDHRSEGMVHGTSPMTYNRVGCSLTQYGITMQKMVHKFAQFARQIGLLEFFYCLEGVLLKMSRRRFLRGGG